MTLSDLIEEYHLRDLLVAFHEATRVPIAIMDPQRRILAAVACQDICMLFHRGTSPTTGLCEESDGYLALEPVRGCPIEYKCTFGLVDVAFPLTMGGERLGTLFIGQFLRQPPDRNRFREQALRHGFDPTAYLAADDVEVVREEHEPTIKRFLARLVGLSRAS